MLRIVTLVEGHGEVAAVPILLRRIAEVVAPGLTLDLSRTIRVKRQRFLKEGELERAVELAARQSGDGGRILILLDADEDCPRDLAPRMLERARAARKDRIIRAVLAKREYEAWFLAAAESLAGHRGIDAAAVSPADPETVASPKRWLSQHMQSGWSYRETLDQPALTAVFDLATARRAPSFDKLWRDLSTLLLERPDR